MRASVSHHLEPVTRKMLLVLAPLLLLQCLLLLPVGARAGLGLPSDRAAAYSNGTHSRAWAFWTDTASDICASDKGAQCLAGITCFVGGDFQCDRQNPCPEYHVCSYGRCQCRFPFPKRCLDFLKQCDLQEFSSCSFGLCYKYLLEDEPWTAMMEPIWIGAIVCFFCVAVGLCACKSLLAAGPSPARRSSDGAQSVNSMQRWIDERLRDRPPRYDEMLLAAPAAGAGAGAGRGGAEGAPASPTPTPAGIPVPSYQELEKPPSYDFAMAERQTSSLYEQTPVADGPPPPYSGMAMVLMEEDGMGFSNPCFEEDHDVSPAPAASTLSLTSVESSSSFRSTASSCSSYVSASSSGGDGHPPQQLLTVSQVVALQEMMLREAHAHAAHQAGDAPGPGPSLPPAWTSF
ncbi:Low-density lipoprotein receptor-related protein [Frankliniella fusca]|uniref:Low-density lipoprotein receptor-related protein n=1 Tax=Frankliniella fusca TaxID=407009 RepID=A0AAE1GZP7_9NEOP|nr:Low-density lipoprotein receptor-related protein [Frankliniella fusca]